MKKATRTLAFIALVVDAVVSAVVYPILPERVPVHWNIVGEADRFGSKAEAVLLGPLLIAGIWALLLVLSRIDPRRAVRSAPVEGDAAPDEADGSYWTVIHLVVVVIAAIHGVVLLAASGMVSGVPRALALALALFLLLPGNFMGRLRPNWFVGIRTPWTLSSDDVWRRTHRLAARLMSAGGLILLPMALLLPPQGAVIAAMVITLLSTLIPAGWSYFAWRGERGGRAGA